MQAPARLVAASFLVLLTIFCRLIPEWDYGIYDKTKFWYAVQNFFGGFFAVCLPSIAILFLWPVVVRGNVQQRIIAIFLSIISALGAIPGWLMICGKFFG